jgi:hypothetical protein
VLFCRLGTRRIVIRSCKGDCLLTMIQNLAVFELARVLFPIFLNKNDGVVKVLSVGNVMWRFLI